jgi:hypothetical protein
VPAAVELEVPADDPVAVPAVVVTLLVEGTLLIGAVTVVQGVETVATGVDTVTFGTVTVGVDTVATGVDTVTAGIETDGTGIVAVTPGIVMPEAIAFEANAPHVASAAIPTAARRTRPRRIR